MLPNAELYEAESDKACVKQNRDKLGGINVVVGDQGDPATLEKWKR